MTVFPLLLIEATVQNITWSYEGKGAKPMNETCKEKLVEPWDESYTCDLV